MNKFLGTLLLAALTFTSCLNEDDNDNSYAKILPGMQIYDLATVQNSAAMQPANAAMRLAVLLAEAEKQRTAAGEEYEPTPLDELKVGDKKVQETLFGIGTQVELLDNNTSYRVTYPSSVKMFGFYFSGSLVVNTNGLPLGDTAADTAWSVDTDEFVVISETGSYSRRNITFNGGELLLYNSGSNYTVSASRMDLCYAGSDIHSSWGGSYHLVPDGTLSLAYSDCGGKPFSVRCTMEGGSIHALNGTAATPMCYSLADGSKYYLGGMLISGRVAAELTASGTYDALSFPSPRVTYTYDYNPKNNTFTVEIEYNGVTQKL